MLRHAMLVAGGLPDGLRLLRDRADGAAARPDCRSPDPNRDAPRCTALRHSVTTWRVAITGGRDRRAGACDIAPHRIA